MSKIKFKQDIEKLIKNRKKIPDEFWVRTPGGKFEAIWFLDRQRPSVEASYDFDMERLGLTKDGNIIWGFDSGCSCPSPWSAEDYGDAYDTRSWKEFLLTAEGAIPQKRYDADGNYQGEPNSFAWFDETWDEEAAQNMRDYLLLIEGEDLDPKRIFEAKNAEVRRYLIKRVGYENVKKAFKVEVLHKDGDSELIKLDNGEVYVKVTDSSTDREYLLYVEGDHKTCKSAIAWTFGLQENEYNPIIET